MARHAGWIWLTVRRAFAELLRRIERPSSSPQELLVEARRWRLLLVPIFATTGANTKLLLGLQVE